MTVGTYGPRCNVHPDRFGSKKTRGDDLWLVLHTSEGGESTESAEALCGYLKQPGDRPTSGGGRYGSSYHVIFDTDRIIPAVPYDTVSYSAGGGNARGRHGCFPGKARQTRAEWLDRNSRAMILQAAAWLVDQGVGTIYSAKRLSVDDVQSRAITGVCDHYDISRAFKRSTHTDVGPHFPWDVLELDIYNILHNSTPPEEDTMLAYIVKPPANSIGNPPWILCINGSARYCTSVDVRYAEAQGWAIVEGLKDQYDWLRQNCNLA